MRMLRTLWIHFILVDLVISDVKEKLDTNHDRIKYIKEQNIALKARAQQLARNTQDPDKLHDFIIKYTFCLVFFMYHSHAGIHAGVGMHLGIALTGEFEKNINIQAVRSADSSQ